VEHATLVRCALKVRAGPADWPVLGVRTVGVSSAARPGRRASSPSTRSSSPAAAIRVRARGCR